MTPSPEIDAVRRILTADVPALGPAGRAAAWERVRPSASASASASAPAPTAAWRRGRDRLPSWPAGIPIAVPAAVLAVGLTVVIVLSGGGGAAPVPGPLSASSVQAAAILRQAAVHLAQGTPLTGTQARFVRQDFRQLLVVSSRHGGPLRYVLPRTVESGYDALGGAFYEELPDGRPEFANAAAKAAYTRRFGPYVPIPPKPRIEQHYGADQPDPNYLELSARDVLTLPADPAALRTRLLGQRASIESDYSHRLVDLAARLLTFGPTPPAVRAGLARLLAALPGVRRVGTATIGGRPADILAFPPARHTGLERRLAFDRRTGELLEEIDVLDHPQQPRLPRCGARHRDQRDRLLDDDRADARLAAAAARGHARRRSSPVSRRPVTSGALQLPSGRSCACAARARLSCA